MSNEVVKFTITAIEISGGDPGYFASGQIDKAAFAKIVNQLYEEEFTAEDVEYIYLTKTQPARFVGKFDKPDGYEDFWWRCKPEDPGAFLATFVCP